MSLPLLYLSELSPTICIYNSSDRKKEAFDQIRLPQKHVLATVREIFLFCLKLLPEGESTQSGLFDFAVDLLKLMVYP